MKDLIKTNLSLKEKAIKDKIQNKIHYCLNCQPRDDGDFIWIIGERSEIEDLFDGYELNEKQRNKIVKYLSCNNCGTQLERFDEIGLEEDDYFENYKYEAILDDINYFQSFKNEMNNLEQLFLIKLTNTKVKNILLKQIFVSQITFLETYLSDALINTILSEERFLKLFVKNYKGFKHKKIEFSTIFDEFEKISHIVKNELLNLLYHNLPKIANIYKTTLNVTFPDLSNLVKLTNTRHDLVHRNGKTKEGKEIVVNESLIKENFTTIFTFISDINEQIEKLKGIDLLFDHS